VEVRGFPRRESVRKVVLLPTFVTGLQIAQKVAGSLEIALCLASECLGKRAFGVAADLRHKAGGDLCRIRSAMTHPAVLCAIPVAALISR
jgi:hypothetical protein